MTRRRRRKKTTDNNGTEATGTSEAAGTAEGAGAAVVPEPSAEPDGAPPAKTGRRRRRGRRRSTAAKASAAAPAAVASAPPSPPRAKTPMKVEGRAILINVADEDECRIATLSDGLLEELYIERASTISHVGNIYQGRVVNVEPSIQAAFIDFGLPKNGFLHISDLRPQFFPDYQGVGEEVGHKVPRRDRPPIQRCLRRGDDIVVQVIKEGIGTKGPTLTTYVSLPGQFLVMMPHMTHLGVSRKIEDPEQRRKMRDILVQLNLPAECGFILRTAGADRARRDIERDLNYLKRLWKAIDKRIRTDQAPCELYQESDLVIRTIRDVYTSDVKQVIVDDAAVAERVRNFLAIAAPRSRDRVVVHESQTPLFHDYGVEEAIESINQREVPLPCGGSIVVESTEAMVTIDVNSGKYRRERDSEETAFRINLEAAEEIARQLRLRDLGGLIVCDFIDMHQAKHRAEIERCLREALTKHKERAKVLRMSRFGLVEITRQRTGPSIKHSIYQPCPHCQGSGLVKTVESATLDVLRLVQLAIWHEQVQRVEMVVAPQVALEVLNRRRKRLAQLEAETTKAVRIRASRRLAVGQVEVLCYDERGQPMRVEQMPVIPVQRGLAPPAAAAPPAAPVTETADWLDDAEV